MEKFFLNTLFFLNKLYIVNQQYINIAVFILKKLYELYPEALEKRYGITELDDDFIEVYDMIAEKRGALTKGGIADYDRVSHIIIQDFKNGYFGPITFDRIK